MKSMIIFALAFVALAVAAPAEYKEPVLIVRSNNNQQPDGGYDFNYESQDGTIRQETGQLKEAFDEEKKPHIILFVRGTYTYTNPDGEPETISYEADENGYRAVGKSIPVTPVRS